MQLRRRVGKYVLAVVLCYGSVVRIVSAGEFQEFQKNIQEYKEALNSNKSIESAEVQVIIERLKTAGMTQSEKTSVYAAYTDALAKMIVNDKLAVDAVRRAVENLKGSNPNDWLGSGEKAKVSVKEIHKGYMEDLRSTMTELEETVDGMSVGLDNEWAKGTTDMLKDIVREYKKEGEKILSTIIPDEKTGDESQIDTMRKHLEYYTQVLQITRVMHVIDFKKAAAVGKVMGLQDRLNKIITEAFKGLDPADYFDGIFLNQYDTKFLNEVMFCDLANAKNKGIFVPTEIEKKIKDKISKWKAAPKPNAIKDDNPNHVYFYERNRDQWYWIDKTDPEYPRGERRWAPYDYDAQTGLYVKFKNGKWYSYAPMWQGEEVELPSEQK